MYSEEATLTVGSNFITMGNLVYEKIDSQTARVYKYYGTEDESVTVQDVVNGLTVVEVGEKAFENHTELTSIDLPDTISVISTRAFAGCTSLSTMT